jgi:hypothetical protein
VPAEIGSSPAVNRRFYAEKEEAGAGEKQHLEFWRNARMFLANVTETDVADFAVEHKPSTQE